MGLQWWRFAAANVKASSMTEERPGTRMRWCVMLMPEGRTPPIRPAREYAMPHAAARPGPASTNGGGAAGSG